MPLLFVVFVPALTALFLSILPKNRLSYWIIAVPLVIFSYLITQIGSSSPLTYSLIWVPSVGVNLDFWMDGLGLLFALIISGVGTLVLLYATSYFDEVREYIRFSTYTLLFMTAMLGIVLSANLLLVFIFWELTSITSYLLIGFHHEDEEAREGARAALLVTGGGGLALMAGVILIGSVARNIQLIRFASRWRCAAG